MIENYLDRLGKKIANQLGYRPEPLRFIAKKPHFLPAFIVSITTRCNFNCPHCLRTVVDKNKTLIKDLPVSIFETILREGKKLNFKLVSFTGGEPILHPQFAKLVSLVTEYGYKYNFASNGWLYKDYWPIIQKNRQNLDSIFLSVDGATAETHDTVRNKPGSFEKLTEAIKFYKKQQLPIIVTFCITKKNIQQLENMPDFCLGLGVNFLKLATAVRVENPINSGDDSLTDIERLKALEKILDLQDRFREQCTLLITSSFFPVSKNLVLNYRTRNLMNAISFCSVLTTDSLYIDHDGGMFFCCDINRPGKNKPLIQELGFAKCLDLTLDSVNEILKMHARQELDGKNRKGSICDFCNKNIESCLYLAARLPR